MSDVASRQPAGTKPTVSEERAREADHPSSQLVVFGADKPQHLECGVDLSPFQLAYHSYSTLISVRSIAILLCHALTGDQHVFNTHPVTGNPGWWQTMVGPGKPVDTARPLAPRPPA